MECSIRSCLRPSRKHSPSRANRFSRLSVWRSRKAPPSELIVPPSNRATISREPQASNPKPDWLHSVIAKAVLSLALTAAWKLSYAMKDGLLPIAGEKCGLAWRHHMHYAVSRRWFADNKEQGWATCPVTQIGFVRISMQPTAL